MSAFSPEHPSAIPAELLALARRREDGGGKLLFQQGQTAESCFYLESGEVSLRRVSPEGAEVELSRIQAGEWFGEVILFASRSFPAQAVAVKDCVLLEFRRSEVLSASAGSVQGFFLSLLARKCLALNSRVEQLTILSARERLIRFVLDLCPGKRSGCGGGKGPCSFTLPRKKREIAMELGMAPETLSRTLRELEAEGLLTVQASQIEIPACSSLKAQLSSGGEPNF